MCIERIAYPLQPIWPKKVDSGHTKSPVDRASFTSAYAAKVQCHPLWNSRYAIADPIWVATIYVAFWRRANVNRTTLNDGTVAPENAMAYASIWLLEYGRQLCMTCNLNLVVPHIRVLSRWRLSCLWLHVATAERQTWATTYEML